MIDAGYLLLTGILITIGIYVAGIALRAYFRTSRQEMLYISAGFGLIVFGAFVATVGTFQGFDRPQTALSVQFLPMTAGMLFILYSIHPE